MPLSKLGSVTHPEDRWTPINRVLPFTAQLFGSVLLVGRSDREVPRTGPGRLSEISDCYQMLVTLIGIYHGMLR